uniref:G-patch domain-containing protein n=1 Tax=Solanum lycopersicum TaxID=4081 RepID=A0A3Q7FK43_SOLLC
MASVMVVNELLKHGFDPGKGLGIFLLGRFYTVCPQKSIDTFGLEYEPRVEDRMMAKNKKRDVWVLGPEVLGLDLSALLAGRPWLRSTRDGFGRSAVVIEFVVALFSDTSQFFSGKQSRCARDPSENCAVEEITNTAIPLRAMGGLLNKLTYLSAADVSMEKLVRVAVQHVLYKCLIRDASKSR